MTIISTAKPVSLEEALDIAEERAYASKTPAFPPINDAVNAAKKIDWVDVRRRCRVGLNNVGLVLAVIGEKVHDLGVYLAEV
jgi:hypothetical protein